MQRLILLFALFGFCFLPATSTNAQVVKKVVKKEVKKATLPALARVASIASLYTANNVNWIAVTVKTEDGYRVINAKALDMPILMYVRPHDLLNLVIAEFDDQSWVLDLTFVGKDGQIADPAEGKSDTITGVTRTHRLVTVKTRRGVTYKVDPRISYWHKRLMKGQVITFTYIDRTDGRWAIHATQHTWNKTVSLRNKHADPVIVTKIVKTRYGPRGRRANDWWYYIRTNHEKIRFQVDSRWNRDVRLQCVGDPPMWHRDRDPSPYAESTLIGRPYKRGPNTVVNVGSPVVNTPVHVNSPVVTNLSNSVVAGISSSNNVNSVNNNQNQNSNVSDNTNTNTNDNQNTNNNQNNNDNTNTNTNDNQNNNTNQNDNQNQYNTTVNNYPKKRATR